MPPTDKRVEEEDMAAATAAAAGGMRVTSASAATKNKQNTTRASIYYQGAIGKGIGGVASPVLLCLPICCLELSRSESEGSRRRGVSVAFF